MDSTDDKIKTLVSNIGRAIVKKLEVKFEGNKILSEDDFDVLACYRNLWKTESEKQNAVRQGIIHSGGCTVNCIKLRINAEDKLRLCLRDKFIIPLDFEMLDSAMPCYQAALGNRRCYEITFNDYYRVISSTGAKLNAGYKISDISLEYEIVNHQKIFQINTKRGFVVRQSSQTQSN